MIIKINENILSDELSPYLKQHKNNPVNWQIWSEEILKFSWSGKFPKGVWRLEVDIIEISSPANKSKDIANIIGALSSKEREVPEYIQLDEKNKKAKLVRIPKFSEVPYPTIMEPNLVIEYYSR